MLPLQRSESASSRRSFSIADRTGRSDGRQVIPHVRCRASRSNRARGEATSGSRRSRSPARRE
uniref:Uncharacterized protein n=1 Tax=Arundo donax TaxID=35708 RepID=A0A0A9DX39_ARUDO